MDQQQPVQGQVQIKADEKELQGQYSNLVMIHHIWRITMNFIYIFPNGAQGKLLNSMILSPGHANASGARWRDLRVTKRSLELSRSHPREARPRPTSVLCNRSRILRAKRLAEMLVLCPDSSAC